MSETLSSAFQISLLRNGVNAYIEKSIVQWDDEGAESAGSLLQIYDSEAKSYSVDWTVESNQPILKLDIVTSSGTHPIISSAAFTYNGEEIDFSGTQVTLNGYSWNSEARTDGDARFAYLHYTDDDGVDTVLFRVIANLADEDNFTDALIGYVLTFSDSDAGSGTLHGSEEVHLHNGGSSSFSVNISSTDTTLNSEDEEVTLTASAYRGLSDLSSSIGTDYQIVWYKNGLTYMGTGATLTLGVDDVDSTAVFTAYLTDDVDAVESDGSGDWDKLASDSERVTDTTDPYRLVDSYTYGGAVNSTQTETLTVGVYSGEEQVTDATFSWKFTIVNCVLEEVRSGTSTDEELEVKIAYADTAYTNTVTVDGEETTTTGHGGVTVNVDLVMTFS